MVEYIPTGSTLLDLALGGGWAKGRIFNIVGDKSSGKTLLAIETFANFARFAGARMRYGEAEAAFDDEYAATLGFPNNVERPEAQLNTVEEFYDDLAAFSELPGPSLYILDSLDALSDIAELGRKITDSTYGGNKAKQMSALFRRITTQLSKNNCTLGIISQVRDSLAAYGNSESRSGGRALDFYSSQILWLEEIQKYKKQIRNQDIITGVEVDAWVKKNKAGLPFRRVNIQILFNYGVDDELSMIEYLKSTGEMVKTDCEELVKQVKNARKKEDMPFLVVTRKELREKVEQVWKEIEEKNRVGVKKYDLERSGSEVVHRAEEDVHPSNNGGAVPTKRHRLHSTRSEEQPTDQDNKVSEG